MSPRPQLITLTEYEMTMCAEVGRARYNDALKASRNPGLGPSAQWAGPQNHIRGAQCEFAVSIVLNFYWRPTVGQIKYRDVGGCVEVRSTDLLHGRLIVKPADPDAPFVLAVAPRNAGSTFMIPGWLPSSIAKKDRLIHSHGDPAFFINQENLYDIGDLKEHLFQINNANRDKTAQTSA